MQHAIVSTIDESDYLSGEALSPVRHEYVDGHVYAMAGASKALNLIAGNIFSRLRGSPCRAFVADMKVKVEASRAYYYPDVVVTCADQDTAKAAPRDYLTAPALIVRVLSETTENIDRRKAQAELYRQRPKGNWEQWIVTLGQTLSLKWFTGNGHAAGHPARKPTLDADRRHAARRCHQSVVGQSLPASAGQAPDGARVSHGALRR